MLSQSVKLAALIVALVALYFLARGLMRDYEPEAEAAGPPAFTVVEQSITPGEWRDALTVRGRTQAVRKVVVRAETRGAVAETPAREGARVEKGDVLCRLETNDRGARLAEARAALKKAELDFNAAERLSAEGFRAETGVAAARAALDLAAAQVESAEVELEKTRMRAPFDGVFDTRAVETGDFLTIGDPCGTVIQQDPFLVAGAASEQNVGKISVGDAGEARLATGEVVSGRVRFIAAAADPETRTFDVELEIPNPDGALRDGVTAQFTVFAKERAAHQVPRAALTLNDDGEIGVRTLTDDNLVRFERVRLLGEEAGGVWVAGLEGAARVIVRGQDFVRAGQRVESVRQETADAESSPS